MSSALTLPSQDFTRGTLSSSPHDVPLSAHLENLRDLACLLLTELDSLGRLTPQPANPVELKDAVQRFEMDLISAALERTRGNQSQAARLLGVKHTTLNAKLKRYRIQYPQRPSEDSLTVRHVAAV